MRLEVADLQAWYGRAQILFGVQISVGPGEVVALIGRNGAGKSTTLRTLMGLVARRTGQIGFGGASLMGLPTFDIVRRGLAYVPEDRRIFAELTVAENLEVGRRPARVGAPAWTPERLYELFPNLGTMRTRPGGQMSGGEQQMLTIARSLMGNPSLVLLDEPSEGLAPKVVEQMVQALIALKSDGVGLLISEQNLHFARLIADRAVVIDRGSMRFAGSFAELDRRPDLSEAYLAV